MIHLASIAKNELLCHVVVCEEHICDKCPANDTDFVPNTFSDAFGWWKEHWDFEKQRPIRSFKRGELVLVSNDGNDWTIAFYITRKANQYLVSLHPDLTYQMVRRYCKFYEDR